MSSVSDSSIWVVTGLGNPGSRYDRTRHNIGFMLVDELANSLSAPSWKNKDDAAVAEACLSGEGGKAHRVLMVKPLKFMNLSGEPLAPLVGFYKVPSAQVLVVHDDIDLPLGSLRIKQGGGDGGHKGIRSIVDCLGTPDYIRVKLGVGRPQQLSDGEVSDWVLRRFDKGEEQEVRKLIEKGVEAVKTTILKGALIAQNKFNFRATKESTEVGEKDKR